MFEQSFKRIDDILRKDAGVSSELDYIEQTSWASVIRLNPAIRDRVKSGHRDWPKT